MPLTDILQLGHPLLHQFSKDILPDELPPLLPAISKMHRLIAECRRVHGFGRAIAAQQLGIMKRIICYHANNEQITLINPIIFDLSIEMLELWDDCMSFPYLKVKVLRHRYCTISYSDLNWKQKHWKLEDDLSELFQHEYDHLNGILAIDRAIDRHSFKIVNTI